MTTEIQTRDPIDDETQIVRSEPMAIASLNRSEVEAQIDAAHKYPRSVARFLREATEMATLDIETAEDCIYSLPRDGKQIDGPSVRLAEICASAWGNMHYGARPVEVGDTEVTSQGVAWDIQRNVRVVLETKRRIVGKPGPKGQPGRRYSDDMIIMTQNAAASIALRNAIFRVIPRAYVNKIYGVVVKTATGDSKTLETRRAEVMERLQKLGADEKRVLAAMNAQGSNDIGLDQLRNLIGMATAIKNGDKTVDELFPAPLADVPGAASPGARMSLKAEPKATPAPVAATATPSPADLKTATTPAAAPAQPAAKKDDRPVTTTQMRDIRAEAERAHVSLDDVCGWFADSQGVVPSLANLERWEADEALARLRAIET